MSIFTKEIIDIEGNKQEAINPTAKWIVGILLGSGILGTNAAQWFGVDKEVTNVMEQSDIEQMLDTKLLIIENEQKTVELEQMKSDILEHANRDSRITSSERLLQKHDERLKQTEDNYIVQQQTLLEIRDVVIKEHE